MRLRMITSSTRKRISLSRRHSGELALALLIVATGCGGVVGVPGHGGATPRDAGHDASVEAAPVDAGHDASVDAGADAATGGWWMPEGGPCTAHLQCSPHLDGFCFGGKCCIGLVTNDGGCFCGEYLGCAPGEDCCPDKSGYVGCHTDCLK